MGQLRENRIKHKLRRGEVVTVVGGINTADMIDFLGPLGFDAVWIDCEHGAIDFADIPGLTRACDLWGMTSLVRVNLNIPGVIYRTLDVGAQGVAVPHVNTASEARAVVDAAKFAPTGSRGMFASRQSYGVESYHIHANDETLVVVLIEDILSVDNLPEILEVAHIDAFFVAPGDLAQSMGYPGQYGHPEVLDTVDKAVALITDAGKVAGTLVDDFTFESYVDKGVRLLLNQWPDWVEKGAQAYIKRVADFN